MSINKTLRADLMLLLVAVIWGATFPLVSASLQFMSPALFVSCRFGVAALIFFIWIMPKLKNTSRKVVITGLILGMINSAVYLLQTLGMTHIDADTAAFTASVGVIFVPFLSSSFGLARVKKIEVLGSLFCLLGLYVLTGGEMGHFGWGALLVLISTFFWAAGICYLQRATPHIKETELLAFYQIIFLLPFSMLSAGYHYHAPMLQPILVFSIFYTAIFATIIVFLIQARYQRDTTATHAAIIYSIEPVLATIIAIWVNDLPITPRIACGGMIIIASILLIELWPQLVKRLPGRPR
jgi:drug/metabolite transporter (DMT)-like permease